MSLQVLELFAGIGGIGLGLERAGMHVVGQVELDPFCRSVLDRHWPEVPKHDDVRTCVDWWQDEPRPHVDLIAGGFPCQPVSVAGRRKGADDERWGWPWMAATIRALRPRYALLENVPGLLTSGMGDVLADLAAGGYDTQWDCVPAAAVGAPHLRDRVFIVAYAQRESERVPAVAVAGRGETPVAGDDGAPRAVADADSEWQLQPGGGVGEERGRPGDRRATLAHTDRDGRQQRRPSHTEQGPGGREPGRGDLGAHPLADTYRDGLEEPRIFGPQRRPTARDWWATEPDVGRVAHGIPRRVDRLRALGNAVVPQVAEHLGNLIMRAEAAA